MADLYRRLAGRLRYLAQWRFVEPVLIFESDDWGFERQSTPELVGRFGRPSEWAFEDTETPAELLGLYEILDRCRDTRGRPACFTANFITGRPDFSAIRSDGFSRYHDAPISENTNARKAWLKGLADQVFYPQYHGRSHLNSRAWLRDVRDRVQGAVEMFDAGIVGGGALIQGHGWRYHSEYLDFETRKALAGEELREWVRGGLRYFEDTFGYFPRSTIAPHYILPASMVSMWRELGGHFVQGGNYRILAGADDGHFVVPHLSGERSAEGITFLGRTVKFEPCRAGSAQGLTSAVAGMMRCFANGIPAVVDTHRINYVGQWREPSLNALGSLLEAARKWRPVFLTSVELGDAISNNGQFQDVFTGESRSLTPLRPRWRRALHAQCAGRNARLVATASPATSQ